MITSPKLHLYIESNDEVCGGEPVLTGTRIPVKIIIRAETEITWHFYTPGEIV